MLDSQETILSLLMAATAGSIIGLDPSRIAAQVVSGIGFVVSVENA